MKLIRYWYHKFMMAVHWVPGNVQSPAYWKHAEKAKYEKGWHDGKK